MTPEQQAAFIIAQAASMMAELAAMQCANVVAMTAGSSPPFAAAELENLPRRYGLGENDVISFFRGGR